MTPLTRTRALLSTVTAATSLVLGFLPAPLAAQVPAVPLTVEKIFAHGSLTGPLPEDIKWSPNGQHLSYLDGGELIDLDPGSGKPPRDG